MQVYAREKRAAPLAAVDGLISTDFKQLDYKFDLSTNTLECAEAQDQAKVEATIAAVAAEAARISKEIEEELDYSFEPPPAEAAASSGSASGFPGHRR